MPSIHDFADNLSLFFTLPLYKVQSPDLSLFSFMPFCRTLPGEEKPLTGMSTHEKPKKETTTDSTSPDLTIVIPVYNEEQNIEPLVAWIHRALHAFEGTYEVLFIDDGSTDRTWTAIEQCTHQYPNVYAIRFLRNYGKSAALSVGFAHARGRVVITMDGDLQDIPDEIIPLYRMIQEEGYDLVSGWKKKRRDPLSKRLPSRIFNFTVRLLTGIRLHDFNCGLKAYRREVAQALRPRGEMHRYLPVLAYWLGFRRIGEKIVTHYPRKYGKSKFGAERFLRGFLDLLTVLFLVRFSKRPMHFFGTLGLLSFLFGFGIALYLSYLKIFAGVVRIAERPLFHLALLAMILGTQLFLAGFLAELIIRQNPSDDYLIQDTILPKSPNHARNHTSS